MTAAPGSGGVELAVEHVTFICEPYTAEALRLYRGRVEQHHGRRDVA
jgi:hypothetical protein